MFSGKLTVPLCYPQSFFNKHFSNWISVDLQKRKPLPKIDANTRKRRLDEHATVKCSRDHKPGFSGLTTRDTNEGYTRLQNSPQFLKQLKRYDAPKTKQPYASVLIATRSAEPNDAIYVDELSPFLTRYMRMVMEQGSIQNSLYDINFCETKKKRFQKEPLAELSHFDFDLLTALLGKLYTCGTLKRSNIESLKRVMCRLSELSIKQLTKCLSRLHARGVLTLNALEYLNGLIGVLRLQPRQLEMLENAIAILRETTLKQLLMPKATTRRDTNEKVLREHSEIMRQMLFAEERESLGYLRANGKRRPTKATQESTKNEKSRLSAGHEPHPPPWADFQVNFQKLLQKRMRRSQSEKFPQHDLLQLSQKRLEEETDRLAARMLKLRGKLKRLLVSVGRSKKVRKVRAPASKYPVVYLLGSNAESRC